MVRLTYFIFFAFLLINVNFSNAQETSKEFNTKPDSGFSFSPTPGDEARKFLKSIGLKEGYNSPENNNGSTIYIAIGVGSSTANNKSQTIHDARYNAYQRALLDAKKQYVNYLGASIKTSAENIIKQNTMPEPEQIVEQAVKKSAGDSSEFEKIKKLINLKLDQALKKEGYDKDSPKEKKQAVIKKVINSNEFKSTTNIVAQSALSGFQTFTTFEQSKAGDKVSITVVGIWSDKLSKLANGIKEKNLANIPAGTPQKPIIEQIPDDPAILIGTFGAKMYVNEKGEREIVAFGHSSPLMEGREDLFNTACTQSEIKAKQAITLFVNENVYYQSEFSERDISQDLEVGGQNEYTSFQGKRHDERIKSYGQLTDVSFEVVDRKKIGPSATFAASDCIMIVKWSPSGEKARNTMKNQTGQDNTDKNFSGNSQEMKPRQGAAGSKDF
jgi:hypothetical protein